MKSLTTCSPAERKSLREACLKFQADQRLRLRAWAKRPIPSKRLIRDRGYQQPLEEEFDHWANDGMNKWQIRSETDVEVRR